MLTSLPIIKYKPEAENLHNTAEVYLLVIGFVQTLLSFGLEKLLHRSDKTFVNQMRWHSFMQRTEIFIYIQWKEKNITGNANKFTA